MLLEYEIMYQGDRTLDLSVCSGVDLKVSQKRTSWVLALHVRKEKAVSKCGNDLLDNLQSGL